MSELLNRAIDPEQYSFGEATSWLADKERQKEQQNMFWEAMLPFINQKHISVLDIGCGSGWVAEKLSSFEVMRYIGLEPSSRHFQIAKNMHPDLDIRKETIEEFSFNEGFDYVFALMMISHINDIDAFFKKIHALLNKDGLFFVVTSTFHEGKKRYERNNRKYEVEEIDEDQYIDKSITGTGYGIADINRKSEYCVKKAKENNLCLVDHKKISDLNYSSKELLVFERCVGK